jgi:hypothetical protein
MTGNDDREVHPTRPQRIQDPDGWCTSSFVNIDLPMSGVERAAMIV